MKEIIEALNQSKEILKIDESFVEIKTGAEIKNGIAIRAFLKKDGNKILLCDNKHTLRYMNTLYELGAKDVKQCINDIVHQYNFKIEKGELKTEVNAKNIRKRYADFLICCGTLANMFIFFDQPN